MPEIYTLPESVANTLKTVVLDQRTVSEKIIRTLFIVLRDEKSALGYLISDGTNYNVVLNGPEEPTTYHFTESLREALAEFETAPSKA